MAQLVAHRLADLSSEFKPCSGQIRIGKLNEQAQSQTMGGKASW